MSDQDKREAPQFVVEDRADLAELLTRAGNWAERDVGADVIAAESRQAAEFVEDEIADEPELVTDGGVDQETEEVEHGILANVETGGTLRVELADEQIVAEVDDKRRHQEGEIVGCGVTVIEDGHKGDIYEFETQYDPRDGWSPVEVTRRVYIKNETEWLDEGVAEKLDVIDPSIDPDRLDPGVIVEGIDGDRYRVVVPPWEREYDDNALTYNLENSVNACEKLDPSEVVRRVE